MSIDKINIVDSTFLGSLTHSPGVVTWVDIPVTSLHNAQGADGVMLTRGTYSTVTIDAADAVGDVYVKMVARTAAGDLTTHRIRVKAGSVRTLPCRGLSGAGTSTISIALATAGDTIYITGAIDA